MSWLRLGSPCFPGRFLSLLGKCPFQGVQLRPSAFRAWLWGNWHEWSTGINMPFLPISPVTVLTPVFSRSSDTPPQCHMQGECFVDSCSQWSCLQRFARFHFLQEVLREPGDPQWSAGLISPSPTCRKTKLVFLVTHGDIVIPMLSV